MLDHLLIRAGKVPPLEEHHVAEGTIKKITDKGFGFIAMTSGGEIFFHRSAVQGANFEELQEGQRVTFTQGQGPKGPRAEDVRLA
jgi:CspA family cold shock protein